MCGKRFFFFFFKVNNVWQCECRGMWELGMVCCLHGTRAFETRVPCQTPPNTMI